MPVTSYSKPPSITLEGIVNLPSEGMLAVFTLTLVPAVLVYSIPSTSKADADDKTTVSRITLRINFLFIGNISRTTLIFNDLLV